MSHRVHLYTGDGKGKTTAAFGLALRAAGHGRRVFIGQFMKGRPYGELQAVAAVPEIEVVQFGWEECIHKEEIGEFHVRRTHEGLEACARQVRSGRYALVILDEILVAQWFGLVSLQDVMDFIARHRQSAELVLTGRCADPRLIEMADLVTEMKCVKHYFDNGVTARPGVEY